MIKIQTHTNTKSDNLTGKIVLAPKPLVSLLNTASHITRGITELKKKLA